MQNISMVLRERGFKVTPQRLAIYEVLSSTKAHPSVEMIYQTLQPIHPTMSLATVYKTMEMLQAVGLVQVLNVGEDSFRYDANVENHPHVICLKCHRVDDIDDMDVRDTVQQAERHCNYDIIGQQLYFYGVCPQCQQQKA